MFLLVSTFMNISRLIILFIMVLGLMSCSYNTMNIPKGQMTSTRESTVNKINVMQIPIDAMNIKDMQALKYTIMPHDTFYISIKTPIDDGVNFVSFKDSGVFSNSTFTQMANNQQLSLSGVSLSNANSTSVFIIDSEGNVDLPYIGQINLAGLTLLEAKAEIREKVVKYIKNANVQILPSSSRSRYINVIGDVKQNAVVPVTYEGVTLAEALTLSGGVTDNAKVKEIYILRKSDSESDTIFAYNLDASNAVSFVYAQEFYMQPNDIVYVSREGFSQFSNMMQKALPFLQNIFYAKLVADPSYFALWTQ